ncbi:hypothetical protein Trydic_g14041 [Trypoxylus dichotomus]
MINSNKITERRKNVDTVCNLLENPDVLEILKTADHSEKWYQVIDSIHNYLIKEAEKMNEDERKRSRTVSKPRLDLLLLAVNSARASCGAKLDIGRLLNLIMEIFESFVLRKYYLEKYLVILHDILSDVQHCSKIAKQQWIDLLTALQNLNLLEDSKVLSCIKLIFKYGTMHKLPLTYLRNEFDFVNKLCQRLGDIHSKRYKVEVLEILTDFCHKNSSDCCLSCCKLGEDVFPHLRLIYQPTTTDITVKELLFEFFLLQVKLHHPKGVLPTNRMAYALSWTEWRKHLTAMYFIIDDEIKYQLRCSSKTSFLARNVQQASRIHNIFVSFCTEVFRQTFNFEQSVVKTVDYTDTLAESAIKRQRLSISLNSILQTVKENQYWQWIYILTEYLRKYPTSLTSDDFSNLLQIILYIHQNNQDADIIKHCYECFEVLLDVEEHIKDLTVDDDIERVYESTLRYIGLNRNIEETHKLLQKIISRGKVKDILPLYEIFFSRAILLSNQSLRTLKIAADHHDLPELINNVSLRKTLVQWILDAEKDKTYLSNAFGDQIMAELLFKLCLKHWPRDKGENSQTDLTNDNIYENFENIYEYNAFKKLVRPERRNFRPDTGRVLHLNEDIYHFVLDQFAAELKELKLLSIDILSNFCMYNKCDGLCEMQGYVLDTLTDQNYDPFDTFDYKMVSTFLSRVKQSPPNIIGDEILPKILNLVQDICFVHFAEYNSVVFVFKILKDLVEHVVASKNSDVRRNYIKILSKFYELRDSYDYKVTLAIIQCIGHFIEVEKNIASLFNNDETNLFMLLPEFLISDYQEVRLEAVSYIASIFEMDGLTNDMLFFIQRELFKAVTVKSVKVFQLEVHSLNRERNIDETVARTSSVLHTYASLIVSSSLWRSKLLYFLIQLACDKKIDTSFLHEILDLVAADLKFCDRKELLGSYTDYLLYEWNNDGRNMSEFPRDILGYSSDADFYEKYANVIIPLLIVKGDVDSIKKISIYLNRELADMFEAYFAEIFASIYKFRSKNPTIKVNTFSSILNTLHDSKRRKLLLEHAENIVVRIAKTVVDEVTFVEQFDMPFQLLGSKEDSTLDNFKDSILLLQTDLDLSTTVFEFMSVNHPSKIQNMLLQLQINIESSFTAEDKTKALHQFAVVINSASSYKDSDLSQECLKILQLLIMENTDKYREAIKDLDPLPSTFEFSDMNEVCLKIRLAVADCGLDGAIRNFLRGGANAESRSVALAHLRKQLSVKKNELRILHEKCKDAVGYSKNNDSILHNLIQMLFKLTASDNNEEASEAAGCLGELGPLDLSTLVLRPGKLHQYPESTPLQLLISRIIELLSTYIIDANIELVKTCSEALYHVLNSKEGKHVIDHLDDEYGLNRDYLYPFVMKQTNKASVIDLQKQKFQSNVTEFNVWWPNDQDHNNWICTLACKLLDCFNNRSFLYKLPSICKLKVEFCEEILPHLVHLIISTEAIDFLNTITTQINNFFARISNLLIQTQTLHCDDQKRSVQTMLNVVHFIRLNYKKCQQLDLDYLKMAHAAFYCSNFHAAVLYTELWSSQTRTVNPGGATILDTIFETEAADTTTIIKTTLKQSFTALGDLYGLYGSNFFDNLHPEYGLEPWEQLSKWDEVIVDYDILIANGQADKTPALINAWKNYGCFATATMLENPQTDYECLWRLNRFNNDDFKGSPIDFLFNTAIKDARQSVIETIQRTSLESIKDLYCCLTKLQSIQELEDSANAKRDINLQLLLRKWKEQDRLTKIDFESIEPIKAQRISILNVLAKNNPDDLKKPLMESYLDLAELAKDEGYFNVAKRAVRNLYYLSDGSEKYEYLRIFQEAQICWLMGNKMRAKYLLKHLLKTNGNDPRLKFASLKLYGKWMAETRSENPDTILNEYFLGSLKAIKGVDLTDKDRHDVFATYVLIARFADAEYERILSYIRSTEFERKVKNMEESKRTASKIELQNKNLSYDQRKAVTIHKKQSLIDEIEIENTYKEKNAYWKLALKYYLINLQHSDISDISVFRILSLLLENRSLKESDNLLGKCLPQIPSYKFISILPQLAPHLTNNTKDDFSNLVAEIIERCAKDHPHHTLPIVLALVNSNNDRIFSKGVGKPESDEARVLGAKILLEKFKREVVQLKDTIEEMEFTADALTHFAYTAYDECEKSRKLDTYLIPNGAKLQRVKNYLNMLLPTCVLNIKRNCNYNDVIGIYSYSKEFGKVGGVNNPKRLYCRGTDGVIRSQLLKGRDDLRQDAVMEQVFENINSLLRANKQTRHLHIRTYKVVPLSKRSGIVEWVEGSIRIGDYLVQAHAKYNPRQWKFDACKSEMGAVAKKSSAEKLKKFKQICDNFKPVFRKFFETNYLDPITWYDKRKAYMYSVATTSMCGYVLGLGDRHPHNILLDEHTAEVIHIDFGIAFEQGKVLPTPETVPFRLTRDIEDAMGVTGIEGIFRKSCEKTIEVMRNNHETITTILEVLLYDPLYEWTISPSEAYNVQCRGEDGSNECTSNSPGRDGETVSLNVSAARALLRVKQKLRGTEEGGASSIEGQVEQLLQQARDISNLSRLYVGWQPFL